MPTLGSTIADIRGDLNRDATFDARIQQALINAIRFYRADRFGFNVKRKFFSLAGEYTSFSNNFIAVDYCKITASSRLKTLVARDYRWLSEQQRDLSYSSEPVYFGTQERQLRVYPAPDQSYSVEIHYHYDLTDISFSTTDSTTTNAWFDEGYELIKTHAMVDMLENYIDGQEAYEKAQILRGREKDVLSKLKKRTNREQGSGTIRGKM